jgi:hypothetical protein
MARRGNWIILILCLHFLTIVTTVWGYSEKSMAQLRIDRVEIKDATLSTSVSTVLSQAREAGGRLSTPPPTIAFEGTEDGVTFTATLENITVGEALTRVADYFGCQLFVTGGLRTGTLVLRVKGNATAEFPDSYVPISIALSSRILKEGLTPAQWFRDRGVEISTGEAIHIESRGELMHIKCSTQNRVLIEAIVHLYERGFTIKKEERGK